MAQGKDWGGTPKGTKKGSSKGFAAFIHKKKKK